MKRILLLAAFCAIISACGNPHKPLDPVDPDDPLNGLPEISADSTWMSLSTHFVFDDEPLSSKAGNLDDLYAVLVYQWIPVDRRDILGDCYVSDRCYAFGYYDDLSRAIFKLSKKYKYGIVVAYFPNGKNTVYKDANGYYGEPFPQEGALNETCYPSVSNQQMYGLRYGSTGPVGRGRELMWSPVERYQGFIELFDPESSSSAVVDLYRRMMGFRLTVEDFTQGWITLEPSFDYGNGVNNKFTIKAEEGSTTSTLEAVFETPRMSFPPIPPFEYLVGESTWDTMEEEVQNQLQNGWMEMKITYTDLTGQTILLYANDAFAYQRNTMYNLRFSLSDAIRNGGISANIVQDDEMTEDNFPF